jgi:hypothetical protein
MVRVWEVRLDGYSRGTISRISLTHSFLLFFFSQVRQLWSLATQKGRQTLQDCDRTQEETKNGRRRSIVTRAEKEKSQDCQGRRGRSGSAKLGSGWCGKCRTITFFLIKKDSNEFVIARESYRL